MIKKILIIAGIVLAVLIVLGIVLGQKGKNNSNNSPTPTPAVNAQGQRTFKNNYLTLLYPEKYALEEVPTRDGRVLVNLRLTAPGSVVLLNLRGALQELGELSEVQMRRGNTLQYSEEVAVNGEMRGLLFRTADRKERTVFFKKNGRLLTFTLTADSTDPSWESEFEELLKNMQW